MIQSRALRFVGALAIPALVGVYGGMPSGYTAAPSTQAVPRPIEFKGTDGPIYALAWAPDGKTLASAGYRQVNLWRLAGGTPRQTLTAHTDLVRGVAWSPDGASIVSVADDGSGRVWNAKTLMQTATLETGPARAVKWSPDGGHVAIGSGFRMQIWQVASRVLQHTARVQTQISSVSWSPDGEIVAVGGVNGILTLWNARTGALAATMNAGAEGRNDVNGVTWSPHGRVLATAHGAQGRGELRLWNAANATLLQTLPSPVGWLRGISWSSDGQWLAAGGEDGHVRIWSVETGKVGVTLSTDSKPVWSVAWSPDGRLLAAGNTGSKVTGGTVSVWEAPVSVLRDGSARTRARAQEAMLLARRGPAAPTTPKPVRTATVFKDDGAYGSVTGVEPPFGNLETSFVESDLQSLGIAPGGRFEVRCREKTFPLVLAMSVDEVARGEWVAFVSLEGRLMVARYFGSASEGSGCQAGDSVFISRDPRNE